MLKIIQVVNTPINSNCFIVFDKQKGDECVIIDPGSENDQTILNAIAENGLVVKYIILTHEHFDHIWSTNDLLEKNSNAKLVCSKSCGDRIIDKKKNLSLFYNQVGFEIDKPAIITEDIMNQLCWNDYKISFLESVGHTTAGICVQLDGNLFTGDTLIPNEKTVTKLPGGQRSELKKTLEKIEALKGSNLIVRPGHGSPFFLDGYNLQKAL